MTEYCQCEDTGLKVFDERGMCWDCKRPVKMRFQKLRTFIVWFIRHERLCGLVSGVVCISAIFGLAILRTLLWK